MRNRTAYVQNRDQLDAYLQEKREWHARRARVVAIQRNAITTILLVLGIVITLLMTSLRESASANASEAGNQYSKKYSNVTVVEGDTLWAIAAAHTDGSTSQIRACVDEMKEMNKIGYYESIRTGDVLVVPTYYYAE